MSPKEKAIELVDKMQNVTIDSYSEQFDKAKKCALIHVDEILKLELIQPLMMYGMNYVNVHDYYSQVNNELQKL